MCRHLVVENQNAIVKENDVNSRRYQKLAVTLPFNSRLSICISSCTWSIDVLRAIVAPSRQQRTAISGSVASSVGVLRVRKKTVMAMFLCMSMYGIVAIAFVCTLARARLIYTRIVLSTTVSPSRWTLTFCFYLSPQLHSQPVTRPVKMTFFACLLSHQLFAYSIIKMCT